jgi:hypothetical protein
VQAALVLVVLALAAAPAAAAGSTNPCAVVTAADATKVLGAKVGAGKSQTLGLYRSCFYSVGTKSLTVQTRQLDKADFVTSAKANPKPVVPVSGVGAGAAAYSAAAGAALLVWKGDTEVTFLFIGVTPTTAVKLALAKTALARV